ncbi:SLC13 family permease [Prauserella endophytica]|uniref:SLC13 family permease n=1 Tax=Prauserella endophytica TaxID=1592324 RepID=A0ABY2S021_9PSEU|nr:SLC13 family permease [Prauserella endophytica]TKG66698.1 SLC13 family permease [Prauserella endophytica]
MAGLSVHGWVTLGVFGVAVLLWMVTRLDDTFVGLSAVLVLVGAGVLTEGDLFSALGGEAIWLLIAAFVLAAGLTATGLPTRVALAVCGRARTVRGLAHRVTAALVLTALAIPATSGRAALALPVFLALATTLAGRERVVRALALLFPTVVLLSAVATLTGAGAHVITSQLLADATGSGIGYAHWLLLGFPFAVLSSHLAAEVVLLLMTRRADRRQLLLLDPAHVARLAGTTVTGPLTPRQRRALGVLVLVVTAWCTEALHGASPALVALVGAALITTPKLGTAEFGAALASVPWSLLLFMVTTAVLGVALTSSGAAAWLGGALPGGTGDELTFLAVVVGLSAAAHLVLQSRSARSSVLVPLLIPLATAAGLDPAAVAFASTAAAGFCHTLPSSAKPVALFASVEGAPTYRRTDLLRLSAVLGPLTILLVLAFALAVWPVLGLPLR